MFPELLCPYAAPNRQATEQATEQLVFLGLGRTTCLFEPPAGSGDLRRERLCAGAFLEFAGTTTSVGGAAMAWQPSMQPAV